MAGLIRWHGVGRLQGNGFQMPDNWPKQLRDAAHIQTELTVEAAIGTSNIPKPRLGGYSIGNGDAERVQQRLRERPRELWMQSRPVQTSLEFESSDDGSGQGRSSQFGKPNGIG
jgi:hypothetical protein